VKRSLGVFYLDQEIGVPDERLPEPRAHGMGLQIPHCFHSQGRKKAIFGAIRHHLGQVLHELAQQKECKIVEGHLMRDHVHICISIPPKHSVSYVVGYIKGKSAISIARRFMGKTRNFTGESFWARGVFCLDSRAR
jgi:putative transposase